VKNGLLWATTKSMMQQVNGIIDADLI